MSFITYPPPEALKAFVKAFAISESEEAASYKVLPDTGLVMGFQYRGRLAYSAGNATVDLSAAGITGLQDTYRTFHNSADTGTVLAFFLETGAAAFFGIGVHELFGQSLGLDDLILRSQLDVVTGQLNEAKNNKARLAVVERFLLSRLDAGKHDALVSHAVQLIKQSAGNMKMALLAEQLHISQSQFEKRFRKTVGASPKKFAAIVRLRTILNAPAEKNNLTQLGLDAGYFDQAHFIKDFKSFTGQTPEQFFEKK